MTRNVAETGSIPCIRAATTMPACGRRSSVGLSPTGAQGERVRDIDMQLPAAV